MSIGPIEYALQKVSTRHQSKSRVLTLHIDNINLGMNTRQSVSGRISAASHFVFADATSNDPRRFVNFSNVVLLHVIFCIFMWVWGLIMFCRLFFWRLL